MSMEQDLTLLRYLLRKIYHAETRMKKLRTWSKKTSKRLSLLISKFKFTYLEYNLGLYF